MQETLAKHYNKIRSQTLKLSEPLSVEDCCIQTLPEVSPTKWHLAHTSWFFETLILKRAISSYSDFHPQFQYLFNSYYNSLGEQFPRPQRGLLSRPTLEEIKNYREHVDQAMMDFLQNGEDSKINQFASLIEIGLHHEQQHQELLLTDIKNVLAFNPLNPAYKSSEEIVVKKGEPLKWKSFPGGVHSIGANGDQFAYDNEFPRHQATLISFELSNRLVTNVEYLKFIEDEGYQRPELWLSDGWIAVNEKKWVAPLYWEKKDGEWFVKTLSGLRKLNEHEPVSHVSYYEAQAYAHWACARLPTESEWEVAAADEKEEGNFLERGFYHPLALNGKQNKGGISQMFGDVWEWTASPYAPYPGYRPPKEALGEYNEKFMCNQMVLRGGSCATPQSHIRPTYRNFFHPDARWQFSGIRLAKDA